MWKRIAGGVALCVALAVPVVLTEMALAIPRDRRAAPAQEKAHEVARATGASWKEAEIAGADGARQRGWLFTPPAARDNGKTVLLIHGAGDTRRGMLGFTRFLLAAGFTALAIDSRGHGVSEGRLITYGLRERDDVNRWTGYLLAQRPNAKLYGLGESMGASILIQSLGAGSPFRAIVAECPYATFREAAGERIPRLTGLPAFFSRPIVSAAFLYAQARHGVDLEAVSPLEAIARTRTPVLLIHGLADTGTSPEHSRKLHRVSPRTSELWEVPRAGHTQASVVAEKEFCARVKRWFEK